MEALMPNASMAMLTASSPSVTPAQGEKRARVALLQGCVQRVYFPNVNAASLRVLSAEGCEVVVPPSLRCCGALSLHAGREEEAMAFARAAIEAVEKAQVDTVIVNSAGCGSAMKDWGRTLRNDPAWAARAEAAAKKVRDISEYLDALPARAKRHPLPLKAAYHDACHLSHAQKIRSQPRSLLRAIPDLKLSDIPDGDQCCGSAGIYNLVQPESSREIGMRKLGNVLSVAPEVLVSANPGCTLHLSALLRERGGEQIRAAHPIELLDASIRGKNL
jgi:glycolate oxidase iron-sulfur subunit